MLGTNFTLAPRAGSKFTLTPRADSVWSPTHRVALRAVSSSAPFGPPNPELFAMGIGKAVVTIWVNDSVIIRVPFLVLPVYPNKTPVSPEFAPHFELSAHDRLKSALSWDSADVMGVLKAGFTLSPALDDFLSVVLHLEELE